MRQETLLRGLTECFLALGFVPWVLIFDNMKTVTTGRDGANEAIWHPALARFAAEFGFHPQPVPSPGGLVAESMVSSERLVAPRCCRSAREDGGFGEDRRADRQKRGALNWVRTLRAAQVGPKGVPDWQTKPFAVRISVCWHETSSPLITKSDQLAS